MSDTPAHAPLGPGDVDVVVSEIKALSNQVATVTARFSSIRRMLSESSLDPEDKFSQHHKQYVELIWDSRRVAGQAHVAASDFCSNIFDVLLDDAMPDADKKIDLEGAMESWESTGASSSQLFQGFDGLCRTLDDFGVILTRGQEVAGARAAVLEADIDGIANRLSALSAIMERRLRANIFASRVGTLFGNIRRQLSENGLFGMMLLAINAAMFLVFTVACKSFALSLTMVKSTLTLSPRTAIDAISRAIGDGLAELVRMKNILFTAEDQSANSDKQELEATLIARGAALDDVRRTINQSSEALEEISVLKNDVVSLSSQLSSICEIYNILTRESQTLLCLIDAAAPSPSHGTKLHAIRNMVLPIGQALDEYARAKGA